MTADPFDSFGADLFGDIFGSIFPRAYPEPPDNVPARILGLDAKPDTRDAVKAAFRARLLAVHPDVITYRAQPELQAAADKLALERPEVAEVIWARDVLLRKVPPPPAAVTDGESPMWKHDQPSRQQLCGKCNSERRNTSGEPYQIVGLGSSANLEDWQRRAGYKGRPPQPWDGYCRPCAHDAKKERKRELRRQLRADRKCEACGDTFTPPRSDARYCSPACRQRAYRQRAENRPRQPGGAIQEGNTVIDTATTEATNTDPRARPGQRCEYHNDCCDPDDFTCPGNCPQPAVRVLTTIRAAVYPGTPLCAEHYALCRHMERDHHMFGGVN